MSRAAASCVNLLLLSRAETFCLRGIVVRWPATGRRWGNADNQESTQPKRLPDCLCNLVWRELWACGRTTTTSTTARQSWRMRSHTSFCLHTALAQSPAPTHVFSPRRANIAKGQCRHGGCARKSLANQACTRTERATASGGNVESAALLLAHIKSPNPKQGATTWPDDSAPTPWATHCSPPASSKSEPPRQNLDGRSRGIVAESSPGCVQAASCTNAQRLGKRRVTQAIMASPLDLEMLRRIHSQATQR